MKKFIFITIFILFTLQAYSQKTVNGQIINETNNLQILKVWGTHAERGYAYGYLSGENIFEVIDNYIFDHILGGSYFTYIYARNYFLNNFDIDEKYITEAENILLGMKDAGINIYNSTLMREYDYNDILLANSLVDLSSLTKLRDKLSLGCSSISSWGESTEDCLELSGNVLITRHLDWEPLPSLLNNHQVVIHFPSEENEQPWIMIGFSGMIGALSGINNSNVSAFQNMGNKYSNAPTGNFYPIHFSIRNGLEMADYNNDSICNVNDIAEAITSKTQSAPFIIHTIDNNLNEPEIIECNYENGNTIRKQEDNNVIQGTNLVATNHFRKLYAAEYCYRYEAIKDSLDYDSNITPERSWDLLCNAAGHNGTMQTMQYVPSLRNLLISFATEESPAYLIEPNVYDLDDFFTPVAISENNITNNFNLKVAPNPFNPVTTISFNINSASDVTINLFNLKGELIKEVFRGRLERGEKSIQFNAKELPSGVYMAKLNIKNAKSNYIYNDYKKLLLLK